MAEPAQTLFDSLGSISDIHELIDNGEAENLYLECKSPRSPSSPQVDRGLRCQLSEAISGFANSSGGVIIWGVATDNNSRPGLDILKQVESIGNIRMFAQRVDSAIAILALPSVKAPPTKVLLANPKDTKGVAVTLIPQATGDPVQALGSEYPYWLRASDEFVKMPHDVLKRMFSATSGPDLSVSFDSRLVSLQSDGSWLVPFILRNNSSAIALYSLLNVEVLNPSACDEIKAEGMEDQSGVNPGKTRYSDRIEGPVYRGLNSVMGKLRFKMKKSGRVSKRVLNLKLTIYAQNMRAKEFQVKIQLAKKRGFDVTLVNEKYLY